MFVDTNAVLVRKIDKLQVNIKKAPFTQGRLGVKHSFIVLF